MDGWMDGWMLGYVCGTCCESSGCAWCVRAGGVWDAERVVWVVCAAMSKCCCGGAGDCLVVDGCRGNAVPAHGCCLCCGHHACCCREVVESSSVCNDIRELHAV